MGTEAPPKRTNEETGALTDAAAPAEGLADRPLVLAAPGKMRRLLSDRSARAALFAFALSRTIVLVIFVLVGFLRTGPSTFPGHVDAQISAQSASATRVLVIREALTADVNWYVGIAEQGYERAPFNADVPHNWAFFPAYPLLLRFASYVTGEFVLTGMVISQLLFLGALFLLHRVCLLFGLTGDDADRCLFYLAVFPTSYFFSLPMSESLFLMLTVGSFYLAKREQWWLAGLCGALASASRTTGVLLLPALALLYWQMYRPLRQLRPFRFDVLALLLIPSGLLSFMIYLHAITGNAFAFKDSMAAWGRQVGFFYTPLFEYLSRPGDIAENWDFRLLNFLAAVLSLTTCVVWFKRRQFPLAIYALLSVLIALSSTLLQSQARYAMVVFPIFMVLATWGRRSQVDQLIRAIFLVLLGFMTAMFAAHFTIALS